MASYREILQQTKKQIREVDTATADELRAEPGAVVLDVREPDEYEQGAIPGSLHIPRGNLESNIEPRAPRPAAHPPRHPRAQHRAPRPRARHEAPRVLRRRQPIRVRGEDPRRDGL